MSDYTAALLPHLGMVADVVAISGLEEPPPAWAAGPPLGVTWAPRSRIGDIAADASILHLGNHPAFHGWIAACTGVPRMVAVLHDLAFADLFGGADHGGRRGYLGQIEAAYGPSARFEVEDGAPDSLRYPLVRPLLAHASAVVVHSRWAAEMVARVDPTLLTFVAPLGAEPVPTRAKQAARSQFGYGDGDVVVGVLGGVTRPKQVTAVVRAVAEVHRQRPELRLLIAGRRDDDLYADEIERLVALTGLSDVTALCYDVALKDLHAAAAASDLVVNLRSPTMGESSASLLLAFGAGTAAMVSDHPQFTEFDPRWCVPVPIDSGTQGGALAGRLLALTGSRSALGELGEAARRWVGDASRWADAAAVYIDAVEAAIGGRRRLLRTRVPALQHGRRALGVDIIGDLGLATGLGQAARQIVGVIQEAGIDTWYGEVRNAYLPHLDGDLNTPPAVDGRPFEGEVPAVAICTLNCNEAHLLPDGVARRYRERGRLVATWYWEAPRLPAAFLPQLHRFDEIWVPSHHVARCFEAYGCRVRVVPPPVALAAPEHIDRSRLGIPTDAFVFLYSFDVNSSIARKHPLGVVEAFRRAFPTDIDQGCRPFLVIKAHRLDVLPSFEAELRAAMAGLPGLIIGADLPRADMVELLAAADCYVSLHRAEGFGLGMAESMHLGKPVIATGYSGNVDFMTPANSLLVGFDLRPIHADDHVHDRLQVGFYEEGMMWAEPDIDQAAEWMRWVASNPEGAAALGRRAAADIRAYCSPQAVTRVVEAEIRRLDADVRAERRSGAAARPGWPVVLR